jgi:hypothetical protein
LSGLKAISVKIIGLCTLLTYILYHFCPAIKQK